MMIAGTVAANFCADSEAHLRECNVRRSLLHNTTGRGHQVAHDEELQQLEQCTLLDVDEAPEPKFRKRSISLDEKKSSAVINHAAGEES
uniref:Uncharacterized protein n=1 Tax=Globodera pallida TaxID=36090 RepID=A0A183BIG5_GLOPA